MGEKVPYIASPRNFAECFPGPASYLKALEEIEKDGVVQSYVGTLFFHKNLLIGSFFAEFLGKTEDARHFAETAETLKKRLLEKYYDAASGVFGDGRQYSIAMAVYSAVIPDTEIPQSH
jgi:hypothetical protein